MKQLKKGMMLNQFSEIDTPTEAYVFASNAVNVSREGGSTELQLEPSTVDITTSNDNVMGVIQGDNCAFVFTKQNVIIQYNSAGQTIDVVDDDNLEINYPIKGVFRVINNRRYLYWGDNVQNDKYICIDDLDKFKTGVDIDKDKIALLPVYTNPVISIRSVFDTSSNLKVGMYSLVTRYLDYNMNGTDWSIPTVPIPVFKNAVNGSYDAISGESTEEIAGKSLVYSIENYDTRYPYIEFAIIRYTENGQEIYKLDSIDNVNSTYTVNFIDYSTSPQLSLDEITIPSSKYVTSSNMLIYDNRLIRSNLQEVSVDYAALQQFANTIRVRYVVKEIPYGIYDSGEEMNVNGSAKSSKYYENKSFLRGEVYAIGLVPYYKNGQRLPVFHIPGREVDKDIFGITVDYSIYNTNVPHSRRKASTNWDSELVTVDDNIAHYEDTGNTEPTRWQIYNTAFRTDTSGNEYYGNMSYFECRDISNNSVNYPVVSEDCEYYPEGAIRHHKMPDCTLEPHYKYEDGQYYIRTLGINIPSEFLTLEMLQLIDPNIVGYDIVVADRTYNKTIEDKGIIISNVGKTYYNGEDKTQAGSQNEIYHQSMMMSYDNNVPKSFTHQMGTDYSVLGLGYFTSIPACSENIGYSSKNNNIDASTNAAYLGNLVGFHSPKSKILGKVFSGTFMKFELELFTNLSGGDDGYYTVNNPNFFIHNNRYKWKSRETKHILVTSAYQRLWGTNRPYSAEDTDVCEACGEQPLYNRNISTATYYDADSSYGEQISFNYPNPFINKTQQEVAIYEVVNSPEYKYNTEVQDTSSDSAINDEWSSNDPRWLNPLVSLSSEHYNITRPTQFMRDNQVGTPSSGYTCSQFYDVLNNYGGIMAYSYVAITNYIPDVYSNLQGLTYYKNYQVPVLDNLEEGFNYFCGDVFISRFAFKRSFYGFVPNSQYFESWCKSTFQADNVSGEQVDWFNTTVDNVSDDKTNSFYEAIVIDTFYESDINPEFREEGDTSWSTDTFKFNGEDMDQDPVYNQNSDTRVQLYYPKYYSLYARSWCHLELNSNSISRLTNDGEWDYYQLFPNYYKLNSVFNTLNRLVQFKPLSLQYDYCNVQTDFPNRVVWSDKAFGSDIRDTFRKYKVLNYLDLNNVDSGINNMYDYENTLWLLTNNNAYYIPLNSQQLKVQDQTAYLGNPSFMSVGPFRVKNSINFGGAKSRFAGIHTPYGYFYISEHDYELYFNNGKIESILDNIGVWWRYNMGLDIVDKFKSLNLECPYEDKRGDYAAGFAGYTLGYDPNHERLLVTKTDFIFPNLGLTTDSPLVNNNYYYNPSTGLIYQRIAGVMTAVDMSDYQKSYTLSYDLLRKQWVSFHSNHSEFTFFTSEYNAYCIGTIQKQLADHVGSSARPLIVEFINYNTPSNATLESFNFGLRSSVWNSTVNRFVDAPNDFVAYYISYNSYQCTKFHELLLSNGGLPFDHYTKAMYIRNGLYSVAGIKDYSASTAFMQQAYEESFSDQAVPWDLTTYVFADPNLYNMRQLRDKYAITRLHITPANDEQNIRIQLTDSNYKQTR